MQFHKAVVIDHVKYAITKFGSDHSLIAADNLIDSYVILGSEGIKVHLHNFLTTANAYFSEKTSLVGFYCKRVKSS